MAIIALMIPLLLCAKGRRIQLEKQSIGHKSAVETIPVEAFIDDSNKELTIEFSQDWEPVTIEIRSKEGCVVYRNLYMPYSNSTLSTSLDNIPAGVYELTISNEKVELIGEFICEN
ncbi:MAG: DUF3244 domain-containing protein [Bacteroides sp.]|nr:DUF3244 domain-containing protein [Bacteroides sp.]